MTTLQGPEAFWDSSQKSPEIIIEREENGDLSLTWLNTVLHCYDEGDGAFDHVIVDTGEEDPTIFIPNEDLRQLLIEYGYPRAIKPVLFESDLGVVSALGVANAEVDLGAPPEL